MKVLLMYNDLKYVVRYLKDLVLHLSEMYILFGNIL